MISSIFTRCGENRYASRRHRFYLIASAGSRHFRTTFDITLIRIDCGHEFSLTNLLLLIGLESVHCFLFCRIPGKRAQKPQAFCNIYICVRDLTARIILLDLGEKSIGSLENDRRYETRGAPDRASREKCRCRHAPSLAPGGVSLCKSCLRLPPRESTSSSRPLARNYIEN